MNEIIKSKIKTKDLLFKQYIQNGRFESGFVFLETLITEFNKLISFTKNLYYENLVQKLNNPLLQAKTYWSILKIFYNEKKIWIISPLLIDDNFVTDIQSKKKNFNKFFCWAMYILKKQQRTSSKPMFLTQSRLNSINFNEDKILKVIRALNIHMAHSHDDIFNLFTFTIIFNKIYNFLLEEKLLNPNQSGFRPSDSCINQLLAITHEIFEAFDCNPSLKVRSVFVDLSKAFDKI